MNHSNESLSNLSSSPDSLSAITESCDGDENCGQPSNDPIRGRHPSLVEINELYSALQDLVKSPRKSSRGNSTVSINSNISTSSCESFDMRNDTRSLPRSVSLSRKQRDIDQHSNEGSQKGSPRYQMNRRSPSATSIEMNSRRYREGNRSPSMLNQHRSSAATVKTNRTTQSSSSTSSRDMSRIMALNLASSVSPKLKRRLAARVGALNPNEAEKARNRSCSMPGRPDDPAIANIRQHRISTPKSSTNTTPRQRRPNTSIGSYSDVSSQEMLNDIDTEKSRGLRKTKTLPRGAHLSHPPMGTDDLEKTQQEISSRIQSWYKTAAALALTQEIEEIKLASDFPTVMSHLSTNEKISKSSECSDDEKLSNAGEKKKVSLGSEPGHLPRQPLFYLPEKKNSDHSSITTDDELMNNLTMIIPYATKADNKKSSHGNNLMARPWRTSWSNSQDSSLFYTNSEHEREKNNNNPNLTNSDNCASRSRSFNYADWQRRRRLNSMNLKPTEQRPSTVYALGKCYKDRVYEIDVLDDRHLANTRSEDSLGSTDDEHVISEVKSSPDAVRIASMGVKRCKGQHHDEKNFWGRFRNLSKKKSKAGQLAKLKSKFTSSKI